MKAPRDHKFADYPVPGLDEVRCPRGHNSVRLSHGRDVHGKFLDAACACGERRRFRAEDIERP